jgi:hypothetical protein
MGLNLENRIQRLENATANTPTALTDGELLEIFNARRGANAGTLTDDEVAALITLERARMSGVTFAELVLAAEREGER